MISVSILCKSPMFGGDVGPYEKLCGLRSQVPNTGILGDIGGRHITAQGTLRALVVFASFPDDETPNPAWPPHHPPVFMEQFIDPDTTTHSQGSFNLTNYFSQMSLGRFQFVGDAIWVESAHSQEEYRGGAYGRANKHLLQERVDSLIDFSQYDSWTRVTNFTHTNVPDSIVDMIIIVWRTNMFEFLGEASLGYWPAFHVDGKRIEMGFPEYLPYPRGSGVTCEYLYSDSPYQVMQTMVHEVSHWLLGGAHPYNSESLQGKHAYWGMLCNPQRAASCANAYERERLGWITLSEIPADQDLLVPDYVTTGFAYKYHPPNGEPLEYFYIENHQKASVFDDVTLNADEKGVWVLHQRQWYLELDNLKMKPSDGNWKWENPFATTSCFSRTLPVFEKGIPKTETGGSHRDQIQNSTSAINWLQVFRDSAGQLRCGRFYMGESFAGAFNTNSTSVFSPYSNPSTNTWTNQQTSFSLEIMNEINGVVTARYSSEPLDASPARRYLGADPAVSGTLPGRVFLAWGAQWTEGQPLEPDVDLSELQRQISNDGNWITVYQGLMTSWSDSSISYDTAGSIPVVFRARVRDTQGKYSGWSNVFYTTMSSPTGVKILTGEDEETPDRYGLGPNYPNPFNPSTTINFQLATQSKVVIRVFDLLGQEVKTLVDGVVASGVHQLQWDGRNNAGVDVASGVYIYQIEAKGVVHQRNVFAQVKKMLLLR